MLSVNTNITIEETLRRTVFYGGSVSIVQRTTTCADDTLREVGPRIL